MAIKDWFTREVEKLGVMIAKLLGLMKKGDTNIAREIINDFYNEWLGLDIDMMNEMTAEEFMNLIILKKFKRPYFDALGEVLIQNGEVFIAEGNKSAAIGSFKKAIALLNYITTSYKEYSFQREDLIKELQAKIQK